MAIATEKYVRKPLFVEAVQVTNENFMEISVWAQGSIKNNDGSETGPQTQIDPETQHIKIKVHAPKNVRQTQAHVGDWILYTERGYKVYTDRAFTASFDRTISFGKDDETRPAVQEAAQEPEKNEGIEPEIPYGSETDGEGIAVDADVTPPAESEVPDAEPTPQA